MSSRNCDLFCPNFVQHNRVPRVCVCLMGHLYPPPCKILVNNLCSIWLEERIFYVSVMFVFSVNVPIKGLCNPLLLLTALLQNFKQQTTFWLHVYCLIVFWYVFLVKLFFNYFLLVLNNFLLFLILCGSELSKNTTLLKQVLFTFSVNITSNAVREEKLFYIVASSGLYFHVLIFFYEVI